MRNHVEAAVREQRSVSVDHPGMKGRIREIAVKNLFSPLLPEGVRLEVDPKAWTVFAHSLSGAAD
jgi:hypothetical protein